MSTNRKATIAKRQREADQRDRVKQREQRKADRRSRIQERVAARGGSVSVIKPEAPVAAATAAAAADPTSFNPEGPRSLSELRAQQRAAREEAALDRIIDPDELELPDDPF